MTDHENTTSKPTIGELIDFLDTVGQDPNYKNYKLHVTHLLYMLSNHVEMLNSLKAVRQKISESQGKKKVYPKMTDVLSGNISG